jgi:hypothetical protein
MDRKLRLTLVPEWDGHGRTAIEYLCSMAELVRLSKQMVIDLGAMAPLRFKDRALSWWQILPVTVRNHVSRSWELLLHLIQVHFLNELWLQECVFELEEMRFRQHGHENEYPLEFLQCRICYHIFLHPTEEDGPHVVACLLRTAREVWMGTINAQLFPDITKLMAGVKLHCKTLLSNWNMGLKL